MTEIINITGTGPVTMSSREIAELLESRHDNVKRTIERLADRGVIVRPPLEDEQITDAMGRPRVEQVYRIGKRDSYVIVAQLSPEFTARLVDRWQELENAARFAALPDFNDPIAAARAWIEAKELERGALKALEVAAPKVEAYDYFIGAKQESFNLQRAMKVIGVGPNLAIKALREASVLYGTPATPRQYYRDMGYFVMLPVEDRNEPGKMRPQTFVTPKGLDWLRKKLPELMNLENA
ncbi:phage antirepressor KilAC domain-containing protein [Pelagibacterium sediminicola]|uniref:phage antirepressor KilAC domain-containing protein n=1 Tax=Pelagibacterium sediminicola TaxID=2248761 RepID=UPI001FEC2E58|nr:phage antirepressor KilAC domain-containing protein [Pelagibacterium sediminicola]